MSIRFALAATTMFAVLVAITYFGAAPQAEATSTANPSDGIVHVKSAFSQVETLDRVQKDIAAKGIKIFTVVDQAKLAADAGIALKPSALVIFGNPPLGVQFITSKASSGLDWPVRLLVQEDETGQVWMRYTDFAWIARRHRIADREEAFAKAAGVVASITSSAVGN
jgi:uncharacterized protein (DUF302 family)